MIDYILLLAVFFVALLYASVGFGGGSGYLAILSIFLSSFVEIRTISLILNLINVTIGSSFGIYVGSIRWKEVWPFILFSVPMALLGSQLKLSETVFFLILGLALLFASFLMFLRWIKNKFQKKVLTKTKCGFLGASVGMLAGMTGIGGGIFISPILNLYGWRNPKVVASLASVFIFFNSSSGLIGLFIGNTFQLQVASFFPLLLSVVFGGSIGAYLSHKKYRGNFIRVLTSLLVFYAGLRLILLYGFEIRI